MANAYAYTVKDRFLRYVKVDTQSDPHASCFPSTEKQMDLGGMLVEELKAIGLPDAEMDENGYVYATIPSNSPRQVPVVCFCSHMDTAPDCSGAGVKPIVHYQYDGSDIILPDDPTQVISVKDHPYLAEKVGDDIITASGTTLLGADDKAGVAIIMDLANYLVQHPDIKHGKIRILFTPDEEVGRGVEKLDLAKLGADIGYTLDAGELGSLEEENFSADGVTINFHGVSAHPGYSKGKLVNALKVATAFLDALPKDGLSPETTSGREGFVHPVYLSGIAEKATLQLIIRDFSTERLGEYEYLLQHTLDEVLKQFPGARAEFEVKEQYRNMKEVLDRHPAVVANAEEAMRRLGIVARKHPIRGGTDGARLSFMGLPCPNIFTGEMALHGKQEYVSVQDMQKSVDVLVELVQIWEQQADKI